MATTNPTDPGDLEAAEEVAREILALLAKAEGAAAAEEWNAVPPFTKRPEGELTLGERMERPQIAALIPFLARLVLAAKGAGKVEAMDVLDEWMRHTIECCERATADLADIERARRAGQPDPCEIRCICGLDDALSRLRAQPPAEKEPG